MPGEWLETLKREKKKDNIAAASRERQDRHTRGPDKSPETPITPPSETSKTPIGLRGSLLEARENLRVREDHPSETSETPYETEAERLGLVATWSVEFGHISIHDPTTGEWHDLRTKDAPRWAVGEARRRKELYKGANGRAYRLTSREMEELWKAERPVEEGIVEDHPVEEETPLEALTTDPSDHPAGGSPEHLESNGT